MNGSNGTLVRAIRGPITLITIGALFALNNFTRYSFGETWPVLLIVFGLLSLLRRSVEPMPPPGPRPPYPGYPPQPPGAIYGQPPHTGGAPPGGPAPEEPPSSPARGGFGSSAPSRATEPGGPGEIV